MFEIPAGHALSWQWKTNRLAILGEHAVAVVNPDGAPCWSCAVPEAVSLCWDAVNDLLMVGTVAGELLALAAVDGTERGRWRLGAGPVHTFVEVPGRGRAITADGTLFAWSEPLTVPTPALSLGGPIVVHHGEKWLSVLSEGRVLLVELHWQPEGWSQATFATPELIAGCPGILGGFWWVSAAAPTLLEKVYPRPDGQLHVSESFILPVPDVVGVARSSNAEPFFLRTAEALLVIDVSQGGKVLGRLPIDRPAAVANSIDAKHVAVTGPSGGFVFGYKKWIKPKARKPDLEDLDDLPSFIAAIQRWRYPADDVEETLRGLLWNAFYEPDALAGLPEPVRTWILTKGFEHFKDWDGLCFSFGNFPEQGRMLPAALEHLGLPSAAEVAREAYAFFERSAQAQEATRWTESAGGIWLPTDPAPTAEEPADQHAEAEVFDQRYTKATKTAAAARMALLKQHADLFAAAQIPAD